MEYSPKNFLLYNLIRSFKCPVGHGARLPVQRCKNQPVDGVTGSASGRAWLARPRPHVLLLASPGAGHLIPLAEVAGRLVELHGFTATIVTFPNISAPEAEYLRCLPASVARAELPAVKIVDLPADDLLGGGVMELIRRSISNIRTLVCSINSTTPLAALVPDFFCSTTLPIAAELGIPGYVFVPGSLTSIALMRHIVELHHDAGPGEYRDVAEPLELPGGVSLRRADLPDVCVDCKKPVYAEFVEWGRSFHLADGVLVNTFVETEPATVEAFKVAAEQGAYPPVFAVGPFVRSNPDAAAGAPASRCLDWLDRQPIGSVVYVSFGSGGALSVEQMSELAAGLEASNQSFLWVVRMPSLDGGPFSSEGSEHDPLAWLPEGFLERTRGRGLAVTEWAPQVSVLSHPATAAFISHCGWNSTLESVESGLPILAWPLYAEQGLNAVILEQKVGMALRLPAREDGLVRRGDIAAAVKELVLEGEKLQRRAEDLKKAAVRAWSPDGSSRRALEEVALKWKTALGSY